ncbi:hypothetical protein NB689_001518 [Xanthomonas sacchari]|nr:hypothetical protein [Xanthomonas sacchari]
MRRLAPVRQAQRQCRLHRCAALHLEGDRVLPRIFAALAQGQGLPVDLEPRIAADVEVHVQRVVAAGVQVVAERGQHAGDVGRAAGAAEPALAHRLDVVEGVVAVHRGRVHFQRVDVEEVAPVQGHAAQHGVVQRPLHHVGVAAIRRQLQHAVGEHHQPDRGAALVVGGVVGQVVVDAEGFAVALRTDRAGQVHLSLGGVVPQALAGRAQGGVAAVPGQVRHAGVQVHEAHRMADRGVLQRHRQMRLAVGLVLDHPGRAVPAPEEGLAALGVLLVVVVRRGAALFDEVARQC